MPSKQDESCTQALEPGKPSVLNNRTNMPFRAVINVSEGTKISADVPPGGSIEIICGLSHNIEVDVIFPEGGYDGPTLVKAKD